MIISESVIVIIGLVTIILEIIKTGIEHTPAAIQWSSVFLRRVRTRITKKKSDEREDEDYENIKLVDIHL